MEKILKKIGSVTSSIKLKSVVVFIISILNFLFFIFAIKDFKSNDPQIKLNPLFFEEKRNIMTASVTVETGLLIKNFSHFNIVGNKFVAELLAWFKFDPEEISITTIENFSFENGKIIYKSSPDTKKEDDKILVKYNVLVELNCNLDYHKFPIEDHSLSIILVNNFVPPNEVMFQVLSTNFVISQDIFLPGWKVRSLNTSFGIDEDPLNQLDKTKKTAHPKAIFIMNLEKTGARKAFIIFLPIFIAFFFALLSLFLPTKNTTGRSRLAASSVAALLTYRFIIEGMMPKVGYFTTADLVYGVLLTFAFIILFLHVVMTKVFNDLSCPTIEYEDKIKLGKNKAESIKIINKLHLARDILFILTSVISTILIGYFVLI